MSGIDATDEELAARGLRRLTDAELDQLAREPSLTSNQGPSIGGWLTIGYRSIPLTEDEAAALFGVGMTDPLSEPREYCVVHDRPLGRCPEPARCREIMTGWGLYREAVSGGAHEPEADAP